MPPPDPNDSLRTIADLMALPRAELDFQHSPSQSAKDAIGVLTGMQEATSAARTDTALLVDRDVRYGPRARQTLDVFRPSTNTQPLPCFVFIHGGFWQEGSTDVAGFAAQTLAGQGWAYVSVGYTLTPEATLTQITQEICDAVDFIAAHADSYGIDPARIVLCGHSAGAHLTACVVADVLNTGTCAKVASAVMVSGVYDLAPVARSYVNDLAGITADEVRTLSPLHQTPKCDIPLHLLIGADEPAAFQIQTDALFEAWPLPDTALHRIAGRDHFNVLDAFNTPGSPILKALANL